MSESELVPVGTFLTRVDAEMAKGVLEADGIDAMVSADDAGGTQPGLWRSGGVRVLVRAEDTQRAIKALSDLSTE